MRKQLVDDAPGEEQRTPVNLTEDQIPGETERQQSLALRVKAGAIYFTVVFGSTFVIKSLRELWVVPHFGEKTADVMEMPLMLLAMIVTARWVVDRFALPPLPGIRLSVGLVGVICWLGAEFAILHPLRGLIADGYVATRAPIMKWISFETLGVFAVMPFLVAYRWESERRTRNQSLDRPN